MQSHSLFTKLKHCVNDYNSILDECRGAIVTLKRNIEKIDIALEGLRHKELREDELAFKSLLMRKRIDEINKKNKLEKMLNEQPASTVIPLRYFERFRSQAAP